MTNETKELIKGLLEIKLHQHKTKRNTMLSRLSEVNLSERERLILTNNLNRHTSALNQTKEALREIAVL